MSGSEESVLGMSGSEESLVGMSGSQESLVGISGSEESLDGMYGSQESLVGMPGSEESDVVSERESESEAPFSEAPSEHSEAKSKKSYSSRSSRAGLLFPVSRVERYLRRGQYAERFAAKAPVYLAAVMQCVAHKIMEQAGKVAKKSNQRCISPSHLKTAVQKSSALKKLLQDSMPRHHGKTVLQSKRVAPLSRKKMSKIGKRSSRPWAARARAARAK